MRERLIEGSLVICLGSIGKFGLLAERQRLKFSCSGMPPSIALPSNSCLMSQARSGCLEATAKSGASLEGDHKEGKTH